MNENNTQHIYMSLKKLVERWISRLLASLKVAANCEMKVVWIARHTGPFSGCGTPHLLNEVVTRSLPFSSSELFWLLQCTWLRTCCIITTFVLIHISMPWIEYYSIQTQTNAVWMYGDYLLPSSYISVVHTQTDVYDLIDVLHNTHCHTHTHTYDTHISL